MKIHKIIFSPTGFIRLDSTTVHIALTVFIRKGKAHE